MKKVQGKVRTGYRERAVQTVISQQPKHTTTETHLLPPSIVAAFYPSSLHDSTFLLTLCISITSHFLLPFWTVLVMLIHPGG